MTRLPIFLAAVLTAGCAGDAPEAPNEPPPVPTVSFPEDDFDFSAWPAATDQGGMWASWFVAGLCEPPATPEEQAQRDAAVRALNESRERRGPHHQPRLVVRADPAAWPAFQARTAPMPVGTVVVKEKHGQALGVEPGAAPAEYGAMVKRGPGYDPANGDWEYWYVERQPA